MGSLAVQPFDILHEYASGLHGSECSSRFGSARFRDEPSYIMRARPLHSRRSRNEVSMGPGLLEPIFGLGRLIVFSLGSQALE